MFSVLPNEYFSTAMEVLEYFQGSTAVLAKEYWGILRSILLLLQETITALNGIRTKYFAFIFIIG
nr:MAG TPA: hypothetical protein [Caudoviricetes sp.]